MTAAFEKTGTNNGVLTFSVNRETIAKGLDIAFNKIKKNLNVPGFRKGHVPRNMFNRMYGEESLYEEALNAVLSDAYEAAVEEADVEPVARPKIDIESMEKGKEWVLKAEIVVKPEVELGDYKGLRIVKESAEVTETEVEEKVNDERQKLAEWVLKEDEVSVLGDTVVIDFTGSIDGKEFDTGHDENFSLVLGSGHFVPGFEEQLVGHKENEEIEVNVVFPKDYYNADLAGKKALFVVKIHEVKAEQLPELDDEFAKDVDGEVETLADLKAKYRKQMEEDKASEVVDKFEEAAVKKAVENATIVELPEEMLTEEINRSMEQFFAQLKQQGYAPEVYYQITGTNEAEVRKRYEDESNERVRTNLVVEKIVKTENIEVSATEIEEEIKDLAEQYDLSAGQVKNFLSEKMVEHDVLMKKALNLIVESAVEA